MRLRLLSIFVVTLAGACASATRPPEIPPPSIHVRQMGSLFFGSGFTAPISLEVDVTNRAAEPLVVRQVRIESPGMAEYSLYPITRTFNTTLAPGQTETFHLSGTAYTNVTRLSPREPLAVRARVDFEARGRRFQELVLNQFVSGE